jgi:hypothetical protein
MLSSDQSSGDKNGKNKKKNRRAGDPRRPAKQKRALRRKAQSQGKIKVKKEQDGSTTEESGDEKIQYLA